MLENTKPILCDKIQFFKDSVFIDRLKAISPALSALGRKLPVKKQLDQAIRHKELAPLAPLLDLEAHRAKVQASMQNTNVDTENGIDLQKFAQVTSKTNFPEKNDPSQDIQASVDDFFNSLES